MNIGLQKCSSLYLKKPGFLFLFDSARLPPYIYSLSFISLYLFQVYYFIEFWEWLSPRKHLMNLGMRAPRTTVVRHTNARVVLLMTETQFLLWSLDQMVRMRAKATEPRIMPATDTTDRSLLLIFHFFLKMRLKMKDRPNIAISLEITQMPSYRKRKEKEMTQVRKQQTVETPKYTNTIAQAKKEIVWNVTLNQSIDYVVACMPPTVKLQQLQWARVTPLISTVITPLMSKNSAITQLIIPNMQVNATWVTSLQTRNLHFLKRQEQSRAVSNPINTETMTVPRNELSIVLKISSAVMSLWIQSNSPPFY